MAQGELGGLVRISGVKPHWWQGQLDLPCGQIYPKGPRSDPIILLQERGFPDGLQPPQALRHRGRAPVLALSPLPTRGLTSSRARQGN